MASLVILMVPKSFFFSIVIRIPPIFSFIFAYFEIKNHANLHKVWIQHFENLVCAYNLERKYNGYRVYCPSVSQIQYLDNNPSIRYYLNLYKQSNRYS